LEGARWTHKSIVLFDRAQFPLIHMHLGQVLASWEIESAVEREKPSRSLPFPRLFQFLLDSRLILSILRMTLEENVFCAD
jgi:hypothetical protein